MLDAACRSPEPGLIHHSDRGSQYASVEFGRALEEARILPLMSGPGSAPGNAMAESFVATLGTKLIDRRP